MDVTKVPKIKFWTAIPAPEAIDAAIANPWRVYSNLPAYLKIRYRKSDIVSNRIARKSTHPVRTPSLDLLFNSRVTKRNSGILLLFSNHFPVICHCVWSVLRPGLAAS